MPMTASERWRDMIRAEHAQSDRMRGAAPPVTIGNPTHRGSGQTLLVPIILW